MADKVTTLSSERVKDYQCDKDEQFGVVSLSMKNPLSAYLVVRVSTEQCASGVGTKEEQGELDVANFCECSLAESQTCAFHFILCMQISIVIISLRELSLYVS